MHSRPDPVKSSRTARNPDGPFHAIAAKTEYSLAMGSDRYYAADTVNPLCQSRHPSRRHPLLRPFWWSMTSCPSQNSAREYWKRPALRSSMPMAVRTRSNSVRSTKGLSICCSQTWSCLPRAFNWLQAPINFPTHGHELAVRAIRIRKGLRVILMSGNLEQELAGYGIRRGTLPFIPKPFEPNALVSLVKQTLHAPAPSPETLTEKPPGLARPSDEWVG